MMSLATSVVATAAAQHTRITMMLLSNGIVVVATLLLRCIAATRFKTILKANLRLLYMHLTSDLVIHMHFVAMQT